MINISSEFSERNNIYAEVNFYNKNFRIPKFEYRQRSIIY